jgi:hypothetical protein
VCRSLFWLNVGLPLAAVLVFGALFILANPDLVASFRTWVDRAWRALWESLADLIPAWTQVLVWIVAACVTIGLLRPVWKRPLLERFSGRDARSSDAEPALAAAPLYPAVRNVLAR